jgi:hypothetical protein
LKTKGYRIQNKKEAALDSLFTEGVVTESQSNRTLRFDRKAG